MSTLVSLIILWALSQGYIVVLIITISLLFAAGITIFNVTEIKTHPTKIKATKGERWTDKPKIHPGDILIKGDKMGARYFIVTT